MQKRPIERTSRAVVTAALVAVLAVPGPAEAHAIVEATTPAIDQVVERSPARVTMEFNEPVEIALSAIRVFDTQRRRVDAGDAEHLPGRPEAIAVPLQADLPPGTYTVAWRVVSADGHAIEEAFVFHVRHPGRNPEGIGEAILSGEGGAGPLLGALGGLGRWLVFASLLVLAGAAAFLALVWRRAGALSRAEPIDQRFGRRWGRILGWAWAVTLASTILLYLVQGAVAADLPLFQALTGDVLVDVAETRFGMVALARLGLLVLAAALWLAVRPRLLPRAGRSVGAARAAQVVPGWALVAGGLLLVTLLATPGLAGHAGTTPPAALNIPADVLHMVGAAVWIGGLVVLAAAAFPATRGLPAAERVRSLAPVVSRFSDLAVIAVGVLVASGLFRAWTEVRALRALTDAPYGLVLLLKMGLFLPLVILGAVNNRWLKPRIARAAEGDDSGAPVGTLRRVVVVEIVLATAVIAATAALVNLPPARVDAGVTGPFVTDVPFGQNNLNVIVDPNEVGANQVHLTATDPSGAPVEVREARVLFRMPAEDVGPLVAAGTRLAPGHFVVQGHQLSLAGEWQLEVVLRLGRFEEQRLTVTVDVNP